MSKIDREMKENIVNNIGRDICTIHREKEIRRVVKRLWYMKMIEIKRNEIEIEELNREIQDTNLVIETKTEIEI